MGRRDSPNEGADGSDGKPLILLILCQTIADYMSTQDDWCTRTHGETGLTSAVIASDTSAEQAADDLLKYIQKYVPDRRRALLAGNTVHADKAFLRKEPYKKVHDYLSHRILDVSTLKEAAKRWSPVDVVANVPKKKLLHKAKDDILESIEEARYYKETIFQGHPDASVEVKQA